MVVVFALMAYCKYRYGFIVVDLEERDIACGTEWNQQFTQKSIFRDSLATCERKFLQQLDAFTDDLACALRGLQVLLCR